MYQNTLKHIGLQFFADPPAPPAPPTPPAEPPEPPTPPTPPVPPTPPKGTEYTQEQLNAMMANEKRTARQALLKELGLAEVDVKDDKTYKAALAEVKKTLDAGKTQAQLDAEARKTTEADLIAERAKNAALAAKIAAIGAGVNPKFVDDVIVLANTKVTDTNTLDKVLESFKTLYPTFFDASETDPGTGKPIKPPRKPPNPGESLGQRLAKQTKSTAPQKSSYFKH